RGLTPYEFICKQWTDEPELFKIDPIHQMPGLNNYPMYSPTIHQFPVVEQKQNKYSVKGQRHRHD
ncbi:hypothetical protein ACG9H0_04070, partial [Acinetobacter ursingii]